MEDYTKILPSHIEKYVGENDLFLEIFKGEGCYKEVSKRPPLLFVHGAYTGSWMWSKYIPHFIDKGWNCYVMNMRSHYKSRVMDMAKISFEDYIEDIKEIITECGEAPILIGFSLGGILSQKIAETVELAGLILVDSVISREVHKRVPYKEKVETPTGAVLPAPAREEEKSIDESANDIAFQKKYLTMESAKALSTCGCWFKQGEGIAINTKLITCPSLVIKSVDRDLDDDKRGKMTAQLLRAEYAVFWNTTHTGVLIGQRYLEVVERIMDWLHYISSCR